MLSPCRPPKYRFPSLTLEGTPVHEIVALQPVACVIGPEEGAALGIEARQARYGGDPELAVAVLQNGLSPSCAARPSRVVNLVTSSVSGSKRSSPFVRVASQSLPLVSS